MPEVSDEAIAREVRTLKTLRRRSVTSSGPGALPVDPDLPPPSSTNHQPYPPEVSSAFSSDDDVTLAPALNGDSFWVPAHLHPELAPGEFRAFLKSHTSGNPEAAEADGSDSLARSPSWLARRDSRRGGDALGRKRSMLSRQYTPKAGDNVENERPPVPVRQRSSIYGGVTGDKGLTLEDLQRLEMLVEEAAESDDPAAMTKLLKRNLSLNAQSGFLQDDVPVESVGAPDLPSRPSSILRRSAITKTRKYGPGGEGSTSRYGSSRRSRMTATQGMDGQGYPEDDRAAGPSRRRATTPSDDSEESARRRPSSSDSHERNLEDRRPSTGSTDETTIFDAYARSSRQSSISTDTSRSGSPSPEPSPPQQHSSLPMLELPKSSSAGSFDWFKEDGEKTPTQDSPTDPLAGYRRPSPTEGYAESRPSANIPPSLALDRQQPEPRLGPEQVTPRASHQELPPGMAPPAARSSGPQGNTFQPAMERPSITRTDTSSTATKEKEKEKEKEKKGGLFSKKDKKSNKKEKDSFLGSLFGGSKKKHDEPVPVSSFSSAGPAAAAALLGASKSNKPHTAGSTPTSPNFNSFARYPIHVERAVYRLSHIKLANARRPLYEQVLISNLMFWYLGVIGRNVAEEKKANGEEEKAQAKQPVAKGTPPRPIDSGSAGVAPVREPIREPVREPIREPIREPVREPATAPIASSGKKMGLTKPDRSRQSGRDAEAPIRQPSYGMQTVQVDHEVRNANMAMANMGLKGPPRPPSMLPPTQQQNSPHRQHQNVQQHASTSPPPPPQPASTPHRSNSQPPPQQTQSHRARSPPTAIQSPPVSDYTSPTKQSQPPPGPVRNGPSPPLQPDFHRAQGHNGMSTSHSMSDVRDTRQRTYSNPPAPPYPANNHPQPPQPGPVSPPGQPNNMRRVVSEVKSPQHSGPQPGQIFRHPQASQPVPPPTQQMQHSPYGPPRPMTSPPPAAASPGRSGYPGPPPQQRPMQPALNGPMPGQVYRGQPSPAVQSPTFANGARPSVPWEPPQRLPQGIPVGSHTGQQYRPAAPPQYPQQPLQQRSPPAQSQPYDARHHTAPMQGYSPNGIPSPSMQPSYSAPPPHHAQSGRQAVPQGRPPQGFSPYGQPVPQRQRSTGDQDMYRGPAPQAIQQGLPYGAHHR
ncbi:hypothetical protein BD324DRAFT_649424 [Kockovaella imperatae]|uniref:Protein Zds1 C-terminal domain-containing protein n=1 Tax=Kockovaella imperatae TaxID=4999 RepID=A0A1Y1UP72_9TREE|nr:hypothetical protein BD324DRAFT_649424 [Kockovaella imperatae]ORX39347.1 hypothetical protein BD324DRAFT_649424 [Kockovaella imperatae]